MLNNFYMGGKDWEAKKQVSCSRTQIMIINKNSDFSRSKEPFPMFERNDLIATYCPKRGKKT